MTRFRSTLLRSKKKYLTIIIILVNLILISFIYVSLTKSNELQLLRLKHVVVHIDLKGAPPKMSFLKDLLLEIHKLGANAVLMEYEDMFPYTGDLDILSKPEHYKRNELQDFLEMAAALNVEVIPLVQTFGHMEFVLKHWKFEHLREDQKKTDSICPSQLGSTILISEILQQIIEFHQNLAPLKHIHIGCDEVMDINSCSDCKKKKLDKNVVFMNHVTTVSRLVKNVSPNTTVLIWDDMLRKIKPSQWMALKIPDKTELVYWDYTANLNTVQHYQLYIYHKYFKNIWIASAYKGADGPEATMPNYEVRMKNIFKWLDFIKDYVFAGEKKVYEFDGIVLTGWARYGHFKPQCELLPVAYQSLVSSLILVNNYRSDINPTKITMTVSDDWKKTFEDNFLRDYFIRVGCKKDNADKKLDKSKCLYNSTILLFDSIKQFIGFLEITKIQILKHIALKQGEDYMWCSMISKVVSDLENDVRWCMRLYFNWKIYDEYIKQKSLFVNNYIAKCLSKGNKQQQIIQA